MWCCSHGLPFVNWCCHFLLQSSLLCLCSADIVLWTQCVILCFFSGHVFEILNNSCDGISTDFSCLEELCPMIWLCQFSLSSICASVPSFSSVYSQALDHVRVLPTCCHWYTVLFYLLWMYVSSRLSDGLCCVLSDLFCISRTTACLHHNLISLTHVVDF